MRAEYETIVASGLQLQLDCPDLALSRHMLFADLSDAEFVKIADMHVAVLNNAPAQCAGRPGPGAHLLGQL